MPHLLELFSGTGSIGKVFRAHGWRVTSVDFRADFEPDICCDVLELTPAMIPGHVDLLWASPQRTHYSIARTTAKTPRDLDGSDALVQHVLDLAAQLLCAFFIENPQWSSKNEGCGGGYYVSRRGLSYVCRRQLSSHGAQNDCYLETHDLAPYARRIAVIVSINVTWTPLR